MSVVESVRIQVLKNQYESLIEQMIMDDIPWMTPELRTRIENAPAENRREMIISIMEENNPEHRLMFSEIRKMISNPDRSEMTHIKEVVQMLRKYVDVSETEIKKYGEVMTPIWLVEEMLDNLNPTGVWTNPNLKWLDPCNGVGPFIAVIVERLMKGLQTWEPNDEKRYKHIMENMIYVCEKQAKNMFLYMYAFDPEDKYCLNIYCGSFLDKNFNEYFKSFGIEKFDNIVMNPPYMIKEDGKTKSKPIWDKFVVKTIDILNENGYLLPIHPDGWRSPDGKFENTAKILKSKQILYLEFHSTEDGINTFGLSTTYDIYCLHNTPNKIKTTVRCTDGTTQRIDISKMKFIPNGMHDSFQKIIATNNEKPVNIVYERMAYDHKQNHMSIVQTEEFKYPCIYLTYIDGSIKFLYSSINSKGLFGVPKVIFTNGASTPIVDEEGKYGVSEYGYSIIDEIDKLPYIKKAMENPKFIKLMSFSNGTTGVGKHRYPNWKIIATFRKDFWTDFI